MLDRISVERAGCALATVIACTSATASASFVVDFATRNDNVTPLENGRALSSVAGDYERGLFTLTTSSGLGAAIFDSTDPGPNSGGDDEDLLVNLGNLVIIQNPDEPSITNDIFDTPNDDPDGGVLVFDFTNPTPLESIALVDIDTGSQTIITLEDFMGRERIYTVPANWTFDVTAGGSGFDILDLLDTSPQPGEGPGGDATAVQDAGYNDGKVVKMTVDFAGSGALTNLTFVPTPGALALAAIGLTAAGYRRRR